MSIKIYNTLTREKETFVPLEKNRVKMYVCGPTVYNHIHIGNARPAIFFDTVRRFFEFCGYDVEYVQNFTDVDDKIIQAAQEEGISAREVSEKYIEAYRSVAEQLGVLPARVHPKVTENIPEIITFIQQLLEKGFAYEADGDVYFRTERFSEYGKLSHQNTSELLEGVRIEVGEKKESPVDFALWKKAKPGEASWSSPWGEGRPGWHIECSAMIRKYLGETIDIHGGGIDLSFPHHENEIAQTECLTRKPLANYWMHNAMITINEQKMSKSLGNFIRVKDVLERHEPQVVRFFMLSGHYRSPLNYSEALLAQARNGYRRLQTTVSNLQYRQQTAADGETADPIRRQMEHWREKFAEMMADDFNTANAISVLFEMAKEANTVQNEPAITKQALKLYETTLTELAGVLGLALAEESALVDEEVEQLIRERSEARKKRNFARADEIRDMLERQGIVLEDTAQGTRWRRK